MFKKEHFERFKEAALTILRDAGEILFAVAGMLLLVLIVGFLLLGPIWFGAAYSVVYLLLYLITIPFACLIGATIFYFVGGRKK